MNKILLSFCILSISQLSFGNYIDDNLKKLSWNGIEVIWLEDNSLPTYDCSIYFEICQRGPSTEREKTYSQVPNKRPWSAILHNNKKAWPSLFHTGRLLFFQVFILT